jgi:glycopeptide antibiotics resistance protein
MISSAVWFTILFQCFQNGIEWDLAFTDYFDVRCGYINNAGAFSAFQRTGIQNHVSSPGNLFCKVGNNMAAFLP